MVWRFARFLFIAAAALLLAVPAATALSSYLKTSEISSLTGGSYLFSPTSGLTTGQSPNQTTEPTQPSAPATQTSSPSGQSDATANWAGYSVSGSNITGVSGSWTVPDASSGGDYESADAAWIGIGGVNSTDLIQTGTQDSFDENGQLTVSAFYEMLPDYLQPVDSMTVSPGDKITASISQSGSGEWIINLKDDTTGQTFSTSTAYDSSESSAEWIEEEPSTTTGEIPLDDFGSVSFSGASAVENGSSQGLSALGAQPVYLVNNSGQSLADVSGLSGSGFTVTRTSASSIPSDEYFSSGGGFYRRGGRFRSLGGGFGGL